MVLGISADQLTELRSSDEAAYKAHLANAQWCEWKLTIQTKAQEYKGERKLRHQVWRR
jgi:subtilisin-like proprotein convertase family protein